jgi:hypothetical protein
MTLRLCLFVRDQLCGDKDEVFESDEIAMLYHSLGGRARSPVTYGAFVHFFHPPSDTLGTLLGCVCSSPR